MITRRSLCRQRGVGLPAAIFVITVMAALAVAVNWLVTQNAQTFNEEVSLTRAYYAAESGLGITMNSLYPPDEHPGYASGSCPAGPEVYDFTVDGLNGCSASVTCEEDAEVDGIIYYTITSEGSCRDVTRTLMLRTGN